MNLMPNKWLAVVFIQNGDIMNKFASSGEVPLRFATRQHDVISGTAVKLNCRGKLIIDTNGGGNNALPINIPRTPDRNQTRG